jgi:hypothetical protein
MTVVMMMTSRVVNIPLKKGEVVLLHTMEALWVRGGIAATPS